MTKYQDENECLEFTIAAIRRALGPKAGDAIGPATRLKSDLGAESIDLLDIFFEIENAIGTPFDTLRFQAYWRQRARGPQDDPGELTVQELVSYLLTLPE